MYLDEESVNDVIQRVLRNVERVLSEGGHRAVLGMLTCADDGEGVHVLGVTPDGPAHHAGVRSGDILLEVDGVPLVRSNGAMPIDILVDFLAAAEPGDRISLHYRRNGRDRYTDVVLGDVPDLPAIEADGPERPPPWQGLELTALSPGLCRYFGTPRGVLVLRVPRELEVDLREGDVLLAIGGRQPAGPDLALRTLDSYQAGERLVLDLMREMEPKRVLGIVGRGDAPLPERGPVVAAGDGARAPGLRPGTAGRPAAEAPAVPAARQRGANGGKSAWRWANGGERTGPAHGADRADRADGAHRADRADGARRADAADPSMAASAGDGRHRPVVGDANSGRPVPAFPRCGGEGIMRRI